MRLRKGVRLNDCRKRRPVALQLGRSRETAERSGLRIGRWEAGYCLQLGRSRETAERAEAHRIAERDLNPSIRPQS